MVYNHCAKCCAANYYLSTILYNSHCSLIYIEDEYQSMILTAPLSAELTMLAYAFRLFGT